jgi:hypothetical protein
MRAIYLRSSLVAMGLLLGSPTSYGQPAAVPQVQSDDLYLYFGFFSLQQAIHKDISSDISAGVAFRRSAAEHFGISESDFTALGEIACSALDTTAAITHDAKVYLTGEVAAGRRPDSSVLEMFHKRHMEVLRNAEINLQRTLSPTGWEAVHAYIKRTLPIKHSSKGDKPCEIRPNPGRSREASIAF